MKAARRILTEMRAGRNELLAGPARDAAGGALGQVTPKPRGGVILAQTSLA